MTAGKADLHIHTREGDGLDDVEAIFEHVEHSTDLDVIAITEHDHLEVSLRARELWSRRNYRFDLVTGLEVTTLQGHLIALYVEEPVDSLMRIEATLDAVHRQGGVCIVPHPMSWLTRSIGPGSLRRACRPEAGVWLDGIELANQSPPARPFQAKARRLNDVYRLPALGSSDAHFVQAIGSAYTSFPGRHASDLRCAILAGTTSGFAGRYPRLRDVGLLRTLSLPIVGLGATPKRLGWRRTVWSFAGRYFS